MALQTSSTGCLKLSRPRWRWPLLFAATILALAMLACGFLGAGSRPNPDRVAVVKRLPTLTRTPLPTLSPTLDPSSDQAATLAAEPVLAASTPTSVLASTFTPASNDAAALASNIPQANTGPMLTALVNLNVRTGPGTDYPTLGKLTPGESIQIIGQNPERTWWQIIYPPGSGSPGWVSGDAQYSTATSVEAVAVAQLPPPPPPTATPTLAPTPIVEPTQPPAFATDAPAALPSQTPVSDGDPTDEPTATSVPGPPGWAFTSLRLYPDDDNLLLYGNAINNTGSLQTIESITGAFFDNKGKTVSNDDEVYTYWPINDVPPGGSVPFELLAENLDDDVADFKLNAEAEPSDDAPRQDFQFTDVKQWTEHDSYCVSGAVQDPGELNDYLVVAVILYDAQDNIVKFSDSGVFDAGEGIGGEDSSFEICIDPPNQDVARYEVEAWGR